MDELLPYIIYLFVGSTISICWALNALLQPLFAALFG